MIVRRKPNDNDDTMPDQSGFTLEELHNFVEQFRGKIAVELRATKAVINGIWKKCRVHEIGTVETMNTMEGIPIIEDSSIPAGMYRIVYNDGRTKDFYL